MKQRILTAIIGIIIVAPIIVYGDWLFLLLGYVLATIALFELIRMYTTHNKIMYMLVSILFLWLLLFPKDQITMSNLIFSKFDVIILFTVLLLMMTVLSKNKFNFNNASFLLFVIVFLGTAFHYLLIVRLEELAHFLFILFTIWATDTGAYFIGKFFGRRKLWPAISPNKTIGGAVGGILFALIISIIFQSVYPLDKTFLAIVVIAVVISIVGQIGDLVASAIKRYYDVKDFGNIFPGHGGILDRLDSLLFVLLVLHIIQFF